MKQLKQQHLITETVGSGLLDELLSTSATATARGRAEYGGRNIYVSGIYTQLQQPKKRST
jgi:hypothetical protein